MRPVVSVLGPAEIQDLQPDSAFSSMQLQCCMKKSVFDSGNIETTGPLCYKTLATLLSIRIDILWFHAMTELLKMAY